MTSKLSPERKSEILLQNIGKTDCGIIALQAITKLPRKTAEQLALDIGGYTPESGTPRVGLILVLSKLGYTVETLRNRDVAGATPATFAMNNEYGLFLLYIERHVMAMVEGDVLNGRSFSHHPLEQAVKVEDHFKYDLAAHAQYLIQKAK